ncbi:hypothetical protein F5Y15DRAFT_426626 [Xylariaceae sp. FL0016]|nr:hypothetical protein F5Y15DRAFT_426626 [Xylariaceae sp. FL0016]
MQSYKIKQKTIARVTLAGEQHRNSNSSNRSLEHHHSLLTSSTTYHLSARLHASRSTSPEERLFKLELSRPEPRILRIRLALMIPLKPEDKGFGVSEGRARRLPPTLLTLRRYRTALGYGKRNLSFSDSVPRIQYPRRDIVTAVRIAQFQPTYRTIGPAAVVPFLELGVTPLLKTFVAKEMATRQDRYSLEMTLVFAGIAAVPLGTDMPRDLESAVVTDAAGQVQDYALPRFGVDAITIPCKVPRNSWKHGGGPNSKGQAHCRRRNTHEARGGGLVGTAV